MKNVTLTSIFILATVLCFSQSRFPKNEFSINGFRNPSIGLEFRHKFVSVHTGYYMTAFKAEETTKFIKVGITAWFLPVDKKPIPSSFFAGASYLRGINREYDETNAFSFEAGFRWMIWKGINFRFGAIAVGAKDHSLKVNPAPGVSYSIIL
ncbi:hypothetical protein [Pollutibacter soli]|uniref:hypothetical protein n=1 Tax=Pollutibacter soli TaxID=3034157 RepID=UPI00301414F3